MRGIRFHLVFAQAAVVVVTAIGVPSAFAADAKVTVGTPTGSTPQNVQSETAVAVDPVAPDVLVAGANDFGDWAPCPQRRTSSPSTRTRRARSRACGRSRSPGSTTRHPDGWHRKRAGSPP